MPRKKLTEEEKAAKKAAEEAEAKKIYKKKTIHDEIWAIVILAIGVFLALSFFTTTTGALGVILKNFFGGLFGKTALILPAFLIFFSILIFANKTSYLSILCSICSLILFILVSCIVAAYTQPLSLGVEQFSVTFKTLKDVTGPIYTAGTSGGGIIGTLIGYLIIKAFGPVGLWIIGVVGCIICSLFIFNTPLSELIDSLKVKHEARKKVKEEQLTIKYAEELRAKQAAEEAKAKEAEAVKNAEEEKNLPKLDLNPVNNFDTKSEENIASEKEDEEAEEIEEIDELEEPEDVVTTFGDEYSDNQKNILGLVTDDQLFGKQTKSRTTGLNPNNKVTTQDVAKVQNEVETDIKKSLKTNARYQFPSIDLLKKGVQTKNNKGDDGSALTEILEKTLESFGVDAKVVNVTKGPSVTRFEVQPGFGVKVASISRLHDDLALNLRAKSLRIEAPIPGKAVVGIEVSNDDSNMVTLREIVDSKEFKNSKSKITVALGRNISGDSIVTNLKEMPHLLIAGQTGSGKSVCINSFLISLMYKATPEQVKLILIDPKVVELSDYNGIPHLLIPVVTEPAKASAALGWAVAEMNDRYNKFANEAVRDLESYNDLVKMNGEPEKVMPQIVIVIDELNDLMMAAKSTIEDSICRLAQKARAAGMHLVVATQRPSVDVITGVIKANIPSRIAFAVSNMMDSRTILDEGGAEHLLGKGDMLYAPQGASKPSRVQGCFVSDAEVKAVIEYVKNENNPNEYNADVVTAIDNANAPQVSMDSNDEEDELLKEAIECVVRAGECSVSMLQRRFRIGYNHAARLVDIMEEKGIVGAADGARKRKVLMSLDEYNQLQEAIDNNDDVPEEI